MSPPRPQSPRHNGCTDDQRQTLGLGDATPHHTVSHSRRGRVPGQHPFACYKAFFDTDSSSTSTLNGADQHGGGGTWSQHVAHVQSAPGYAEQQQDRSRPVPPSVAVRLANRSNGVPLATIVEQVSVSTLNSPGSLLGVGRFPAICAVEEAPPGHASHRHTRSLDHGALNRVQEKDQDEQTVSRLVPLTVQESPIPQIPELNLDVKPKSLKGFFRGVLTKVRSNTRSRSRSRSRSSSGTDVPMPNQWFDVRPSAQTDEIAPMKPDSQAPFPFTSAATTLLQPTPSSPHHVSGPQVVPKSKTKSLADGFTSQSHGSTSTIETQTAPVGLRLPLIPELSRLQFGDEVLPSACTVPRDAALDHVRHAATTALSRSRDELATRYTPDGAFILSDDGGSLDDFARYASRNASFCSTMSTSYSGTVLGIDLDVQPDISHPTRRSVTPVWFSPKEPGKTQKPPKPALKVEGVKPLRPRSITSSALASLLPIAAAEGIVHQNLTSPQLAFYSPSGNLIQTLSASPARTPTSSSRSRSRSESYFSGTPTTKTSYYNGANLPSAQSALSVAFANPPARPALVPLTTLPQSIAPLPEHLRHQHKYHRVERLSIGSVCDSEIALPSQAIMIANSQVLGCGGVIRPPNLDPHSGVRQYPPKRSRIGQSMSCLRTREANHLAVNTSSLLSSNSSCKRGDRTPAKEIRKKGKTLRKRRVLQMDTVPDKDVIGLGAAHALRVCFCQPYDGVGTHTAGVGCGGAATTQPGEHLDESRASPTGLRESTPNYRIVAEATTKGKRRVRRDSAVSVGAVGRQSGGGSDTRWDASLP
ncbi:hypothetical protein PMIN06_011586 [Paraphaeosphaeria minitans]|uniref:Uncharacterized protein n=1 Tax=Paraphaeosphaeria minitans TaxID=565426 RepID=A0A9P6GSV6_9PLEO|nr:hypothetical protein PMIN01_00761 [Paraphaeosphaeria minitans]